MNTAFTETENRLLNLSHIIEAMYLAKEDGTSMIDDLKQYTADSYTAADLYSSNQRMQSICQDFIYFSEYINGIFIFTADGPTLGFGYGNGINVPSDYAPAGEDWYQATLSLSGDTYVYGPSQKAFLENGSISLSFCTALYDVYSREFLGVLFVDCTSEIFDLSAVNSLPNISQLQINNETTLLYQTQSESGAGLSFENALKLERSLSLSNLSITVSIDKKELYSEFRITQLTLIFLSAVCIFGMLALSIFLSRDLIHPISVLSGRMLGKDSGRQDVTDSPYLSCSNEIGTLYNSYQEMLDKQNAYIKNELENKLIVLDSQMQALESQINAHFLYNTLESINSIAVLKRVPEIAVMARSLGNMFRYSIKTTSELVALSEELCHIKDYASIQRIRFDNAFLLQLDIPEELLVKKVLKLILQPLVENALYHGLQNCTAGDTIAISARVKGANLLLAVSDNGVGMSSETLCQLQATLSEKAHFTELGKRRGRNIGIKNLNTRIALYYGEAYGLAIESAIGEGSVVTITLPLGD